jgi:hypothetical protein
MLKEYVKIPKEGKIKAERRCHKTGCTGCQREKIVNSPSS